MNLKLMLLPVLILCVAATHANGDIVYDPISEFSNLQNPNGVWSYSFSNSTIRDENYMLFAETAPLASGAGGGSLVWHGDSSATAQRPFAGINTTGSNGSSWQIGELALHPGQNNGGNGNGLAVMTWTAPRAGSVDVNISLAMGLSGSVDWFFDLNGSSGSIGSGSLSGISDSDQVSFDNIFVSQGDNLHLVIDSRDGVGSDLVRITQASFNHSAVPEPSTTVLFGAVLSLVCVRRRRSY
ncbi:MAG: PEP-CTERM sorting domain-containing protein [Planctomycetota bacterium]